MTEEQFQALVDLIRSMIAENQIPAHFSQERAEEIYNRSNAVRVRAHDLLVEKKPPLLHKECSHGLPEVKDFTLDTPLEAIPMQTRAFWVLCKILRYTCLREIAALSDAELLREPNFGPKSLYYVRALIAKAKPLSN